MSNQSNYNQWYAIRKSDHAVIAEGDSYQAALASAVSASGWSGELGIHAPYFMTNAPWFGNSLHTDFHD